MVRKIVQKMVRKTFSGFWRRIYKNAQTLSFETQQVLVRLADRLANDGAETVIQDLSADEIDDEVGNDGR